MSYIRFGSNPEKLYIWGDCFGIANIWAGFEFKKTMPIHIFEGLLAKYEKNWYPDICKYRGAKVEELFVVKKKQNKIAKEYRKVFGPDGDFQMRLSYKDWHIDMWRVTWHYIVSCNYHRQAFKAKRKKK